MPQTIVEVHNLESQSLPQSTPVECGALRGPQIPQFLERSVVELFEQQAVQNPSKPAVIAGDRQLTYAELNHRANQVAQQLRSLGAARESLVGICIDRSLDMAIGILGILKSGAAYLPLDPEYPSERLAFMIQDARPYALVTSPNVSDAIPSNNSHVVLLDDEQMLSSPATGNVSEKPQAADLAYVIYTSGSTGQPKGVMIEHINLSNYLLALDREIGIRGDDTYLHLASIAFSSSRRQLLLPLSQGATVVIADANERKDPVKLFELIKSRGVTIMDAVPSFWRNCTTILAELEEPERRELLDNRLRLMLSASEPLTSDIPRTWAKEFLHPARHVHMFGQTETAGIVCLNEISAHADHDGRIPIGRPIANTEIRIVDENMNPCLPGDAGELLIGGAGVGRGYLNRPDLSSEKFVTKQIGRFYRTGDFARLREDGKIEFAGRRDQQLKIRGFRVELAEVETALATHAAVREVVVVAKTDAHQNTRLVAYFVPSTGAPGTGEMRALAYERLPEHAVPSVFIALDALPLSANGKVNRLALAEHNDSAGCEANPYTAPGTGAERQLISIFSEVLHIDHPGIDDNFFELGGNSLLAGQAIARIRRAFQIDAPITWLFDSPAARALAVRIESAVKTEAADMPLRRVSRAEPLPLSPAQHRLWFLDQLEPGNHTYNIAHAIGIRGALDIETLRRCFDGIVARHEILRTRFVEIDGMPYQQADLPTQTDWRLFNLSGFNTSERDHEARRIVEAESRKPFDLSTGPLMRVRLLLLEPDQFVLLITLHHIVSDGWSAQVLANELSAFYDAFTSDTSPALGELPAQYADFAASQHESSVRGALAPQLAYWKQQLRDAPPVLNLPTDRIRPAEDGYHGGQEALRLSTGLVKTLTAFSQSEGVTLFMTLLTAFDVMLARYSGDNEIVVGTPVAGRTSVETEPLIGMFVNTLPLRVKVSPELTVRQLVPNVREVSLSAYANQSVPFDSLVNALQCDRTAQHHPIFQVMFALQRPTPLPRLAELEVKAVKLHKDTAKFDLALDAIDQGEDLELQITYRTDLFEAQSVRCMLSDFQLLLQAFTENPDQRVCDLPAMTWAPKQSPARSETTSSSAASVYVAPRTPIEEQLVSIWSEVLLIDRVGIDDNFFMLGGHSLMATQLIGRVRNAFGFELPLRRLFQTPTISGLAAAIYESQTSNTNDEEFAALLAELDGLSDDEALQQFANEQAA